MNNISLIANTGIQFINIDINLKNVDLKKCYCNIGSKVIEENGEKYSVPTLVDYDNERDIYIDDTGEEIDEENFNNIKATQAIELFRGKWVPLPFFIEEQYSSKKKYKSGPIGWCRAILYKKEGTVDEYILTLAFDTYTDNNDELKYNKNKHITLTTNDVETGLAKASLVDNTNDNSSLLEEEWLDKYLQKIVDEGREIAGISKATISNNPFYYLGAYIAYLKFLKLFTPNIVIYPSIKENSIDVDFVLDIGNSRSCGILLETTQNKFNTFNFTNATNFTLRNLQKPYIVYNKPFEMKVEFIKSNFGELNIDGWDKAFNWPSVVRVGQEAIDKIFAVGKLDVPTGMSSPKRYLWDDSYREIPWHFNPGRLDITPEPINCGETILTNLPIDVNGKLSEETSMHLDGKYSRKAIMTFTLIEIILHAINYINSVEFRVKNGKVNYRRNLKRVVLTTPTAMLNNDKKTFRECAENAINILKESYSYYDENLFEDIQILPSASDVITDPEQASLQINRKEWGFDEATCVQLAFMYGEITNKYQNNIELFFDIEGKKRTIIDKNNHEISEKMVTVASLDIGGGTTDLMICSYLNESKGNVTVITPYPEFYEGFNIAGDDILKRIIERLVIRQIESYTKEKGCNNAMEHIGFMFGEYSAFHTSRDKEYKKSITSQFLIPVALYALEFVSNLSSNENIQDVKNFNEIIDKLKKGDRIRDNLLNYVNGYFERNNAKDFKLDEIKFTFNSNEINNIITQVMSPIINKLSTIIREFKCDYFIIAGQPSKLKVIRDLINRYLPITPDKVIPMGNYYIGKWYPFAKSNGLINDPKTTVSVGAAVALMSGTLLKLDRFRIDTYYLKEKVKSTARYIGGYDSKNKLISNLIFTPNKSINNNVIFNGATYIGMKQLDVDNWPGSCMYKIDFTDEDIAKRFSKRLPFKLELERKPQNPEIILKNSIEDSEGMPVSNSNISLIPQTLGNEDGYWLDTGIFHTSIY